MKCINCLRKHLAVMKSFMREVIDGHGEGANPDHRINIEGEIVNAEYHASLIDNVFMRKLRTYRRKLMTKRFKVDISDLDIIDAFYYYTDKFDGYDVDNKYVKIIDDIKLADEVSNISASTLKNGCGCNKK